MKEYVRKADEVFELYKRILAKQGYVLRELEGCLEPNYELIKR